jgi:RNA polymerase primary sigma factor
MGRQARRTDYRISEYFAEVSKHKRLSRAEEHELALRARAGDARARDRLVRHSLGLVVAVVRGFSLGSVRVDDLIQEGNLGLLHALEKFDPDAGTRFATYAVWWIRAFVGKYLNEARSVVRPRGGSAATADLSLDAGIDDEEEGTTFLDRVEDEGPGPERALMAVEAGLEVRRALERSRQRIGSLGADIIKNRLQREERHTLEAVGARWGLSRERVRQVELVTKRLLSNLLEDSIAA